MCTECKNVTDFVRCPMCGRGIRLRMGGILQPCPVCGDTHGSLPEVKPCPKCGSGKTFLSGRIWHDHVEGWQVYCAECFTTGVEAATEDHAILAWNSGRIVEKGGC